MTDISQSEIIRERKWEKALFTTYALSLTFFETILLPRLRESNCREIYVLADSDGYADSLIERRSSSVGKEFILLPVLVPAPGIFHPKITYLWGEEDTLMVGSGNLTFGGHGRNVEVLEILQKDTDPQAFLDFSDFLEALIARDEIKIPDPAPLVEFAARSRRNVGPTDTPAATRILHTINTSISQQVIAHFAGRTPVQEILCLSPYHHPEASPVKELVDTLSISRLVVGMPSKKQETTSFPMHHASTWGIKLALVAPSVEKPNRSLHAKWLEFRGDETWSFTGSVNATQQSLSTTRNVEIGVLRQLSEPTSSRWVEADAPEYKKNEFIPGSRAHFLPVFAKLSEGGSISGQIIGGKENSGWWQAHLHESGNQITSGSIEVSETNEFEWNIGQLIQVVHGNAIQIQLRRADNVARGWLSVQAMLRLSSRSRAGIRAISRMLRREDSLDDIKAVLDLIAIHSHKILAPIRDQKSAGSQAPEAPSEDLAFPARDLTLDVDEAELVNNLIQSESRERSSADVLRLIGQLFRGKKAYSERESTLTRPKPKSTDDEDGEDEDSLETAKKIAALEVFNKQMSDALISAKDTGTGVEAILFVWLHVNLDMMMRDIEDGGNKFVSFAARWMNLVASHSRMHQGEDALSGPIFGVAAFLGQFDAEGSDKHLFYKHLGLSLAKLHQCLESYVGGSVKQDKALQDAQAWMRYSSVLELVHHQVDEALHSLVRILGKPTYRAVLYSIVKAAKNGATFDFPSEMFDARVLALINAIQRARPPFSNVRFVDHHSVTSCSSCNAVLLNDTLSKLRSSRIVKCDNCSTILLALKP